MLGERELLWKVVFDEELKQAACFEMNWLPTKVSDSFAKGTPPMIHGNSSTATDATSQDDSKDAGEVRDTPSENLRAGAQQMLSAAIESEVADYIEARKGIVDDAGCRLVVRNCSSPERQVTTGFGPVSVRQPRVRDKRSTDRREVFPRSVFPSMATVSPSS